MVLGPAKAQQTAQGLSEDWRVTCLKQGWELTLWEVVPVSVNFCPCAAPDSSHSDAR